VEDNNRRPEAQSLREHPEYAAEHLSRIKQDTIVGMTFSNVIALCIVVATAVTLNLQGIIRTGLLAVPVLAGSAAYAVSELYGWKAGLSHGFREAKGFYLIIVAATGIGTVMGYLELDPIKALVWSAIVNGVISVPIMAALLWIGQSERLMGQHTITARHRFFGWTATAVMAVAVVVMLATSF